MTATRTRAAGSLGIITGLCLLATVVLATPAAAQTWSPAGNLALPRYEHHATLLSDGRVLVTGGSTAVGNTYDTRAAEVYDPAANAWSSAGATANGRAGHVASALPDGRVLVAGGVNANVCTSDTTAEVYDPATNSWSFTGSLSAARYYATGTALPDGRVLVAGGGNRCGTVFNSAEIYDPATGTWSTTGSMTTPREFHDAVALADGRVMVVGGVGPCCSFPALSSAQIYDPATGTWAATGSMATTRIHPSLAALPDGRVLATGGYSGSGFGAVPNGPDVEVWDPSTGTWSATGSLSVPRSGSTLTVLADGGVLAVGGTDGSTYHTSAETWDPGTGAWSPAGAMAASRASHSATVVNGGSVLVAGGYNGAPVGTAELFAHETYDFSGFFAPVNNPPTFNRVKAGAAVPVKFSLNGDQGLDIFEAGYPKSQPITCDTAAPSDGIEETATAGSSSLSYDAATDEYTYVWKTERGWTGCRQLIVKLDDGTTHLAYFSFR
ncbi:MAG TPA: PxKF domain-containing protein [Actinomycetota bacterium]|nr:PxKF domain-containing protein [Actinomycetota bacterium]